MKKYMTYAVTAFFATITISLAAPDKAAIEAKEKAAWQAFKDKKADDFKKVVDEDFRWRLCRRPFRYAEGIGRYEEVGHEVVYHQRFHRLL